VRAPSPLLSLLAAALALCAVVPAVAGEPPARRAAAPVSLPLKDGTTVSGTVVEAGPKEVVVRDAAGAERRLPTADLAPEGALAALAALVRPDDGRGRLELAEIAAEMGLYARAREEYEKALALGAIDAATHAKAVAAAEDAAVGTGVARAERAADAGDVAGAFEILRLLKVDFASSPSAARVDAVLRRLETAVAEREEEQAKAQAELERMTLEADRARERLRRKTEARAKMARGGEWAAEARAEMEKGVVTRARKRADAAQEAFQDARRDLGRLRRIVPREGPARTEVLAMLTELDRDQFALLLAAATFFWREKVYNEAERFAALASYIDPVHPDLLELRREIREHRIRYRASELTNAWPR
jgi:tetratricopeptide (TPR) repeat protein